MPIITICPHHRTGACETTAIMPGIEGFYCQTFVSLSESYEAKPPAVT